MLFGGSCGVVLVLCVVGFSYLVVLDCGWSVACKVGVGALDWFGSLLFVDLFGLDVAGFYLLVVICARWCLSWCGFNDLGCRFASLHTEAGGLTFGDCCFAITARCGGCVDCLFVVFDLLGFAAFSYG